MKAANPDAKGVFVHLKGTLYVSDQIVIDKKVGHIGGLFGDGMVGRSQNGQGTEIRFDKVQEGMFNSNTNEMDIRRDAGVLVDGVDGVTIANLSVKYTADDFYREGYSYFGKVNGIMVNDADHTTIRSVEVSGANRAGVFSVPLKPWRKTRIRPRGAPLRDGGFWAKWMRITNTCLMANTTVSKTAICTITGWQGRCSAIRKTLPPITMC